MKKIVLIIIILVVAYFSLSYFSDNLDGLFKFWEKMHTKLTQWLEENIFPRIKKWFEPKKEIIREEFEKEKQEIGQSLKEIISKIFSSAWDFTKDIID